MTTAEAVLRWWLAFSLVTVAFAPLTWWMAAGLGRYRHALLRPVGLVAATFVVWWPAALVGLPFQLVTVVAGIVVAGLAGWIAFLLRTDRSLLGDLKTLATFELVWLAAFLGYVWFRMANPDIANTEKPMEIALLSSVVRSGDVPAPDPWYAGSPINYYYFGYQSVATLVHLSGIKATVAFNLMLASLFASTVTVSAGLGGWLADRFRFGSIPGAITAVVAAFFVGLAGNLETFVRLVRSPGDTISAGWWDGVGWQASRVIVDTAPSDTINEFPAFSFVLGDLHPHVLTLPVLLATIALAAGLAGNRHLAGYARVGAIGAFAGLLYASNSWDAPVGVVVVLGAIALAFRRINREVLVRFAVALAGAVVAALPFAIDYTAPVGVSSGTVPGWLARIPVLGSLPDTIAVVTWRPSSTSELLVVHGVWVAAGVLFAGWAYASSPEIRELFQSNLTLILPAALVLVALAIAWAPAVVLLGIPGLLLLAIAVRDERPGVRLTSALFAAGFGLALIPEFLYIQDSFGNRMNTVFKLNFQAWIFLGPASAVAVVVVAREVAGNLRMPAIAAASLLVLMVAPYALLSAEDWRDGGAASGTLDGAAYLDAFNPAEAAGINWLDSHAGEGDVIVEAPGCAYQTVGGVPMNRFSAYTGVPTLLGWANHERQWRRGEFDDLTATINARDALAASWLAGQPNPTQSGIEPRFVILGAVERTTTERCPMLVAYGETAIAGLESRGWTVAFQQGQTTIMVRQGDPVVAGRD